MLFAGTEHRADLDRMRAERRNLEAARRVASLRPMDLEEAGLAAALRDQQHDRRIDRRPNKRG